MQSQRLPVNVYRRSFRLLGKDNAVELLSGKIIYLICIFITEYKTASNLSLGSKLQALMSLSTTKQVTAD